MWSKSRGNDHRPLTVTLRLITDASEEPLAAPVDVHPELPPEAFEQLFSLAGSLLAIFDGQARFVAVNAACERVLGCPPDQLIGQSLLDCLHPHDPTSAVRKAAGAHGWNVFTLDRAHICRGQLQQRPRPT